MALHDWAARQAAMFETFAEVDELSDPDMHALLLFGEVEHRDARWIAGPRRSLVSRLVGAAFAAIGLSAATGRA